jgi:hypothetical protein
MLEQEKTDEKYLSGANLRKTAETLYLSWALYLWRPLYHMESRFTLYFLIAELPLHV